jgi:hypothetical protein
MNQYVIIHGNVSTGIEEIIGPFDSPRAADKWLRDHGLEDDPYYPYIPLTSPQEILASPSEAGE